MAKGKTAKKKPLECLICNKALGKSKTKLQCQQCGKRAHQQCTDATRNWTCAKCMENEQDEDSDSEEDSEDELSELETNSSVRIASTL
ncbi:unnamed protein product [Brassicogethes aeneus]|uniref:Phorbol-ester/DAG-type domain-containing protein n=1 Tax=Brassicogethes aeneus TaxID=1431903 RepID=A0A9P0AYN0_BRAAE|nr:unnamed protein product [Brassicogethes aeneus]